MNHPAGSRCCVSLAAQREATATGAEWIDVIARQAQEIKLHGAGQLVIGHTDWGVKHFR